MRNRQTVTAFTTTKTVKVTSTSTILTTIKEVDLSVEFTAIVSTSIVPDMKRHANGKAVPTYASACTSDGQYASACSCFGVLPPFTKTATAHSVVRSPPLHRSHELTPSGTHHHNQNSHHNNINSDHDYESYDHYVYLDTNSFHFSNHHCQRLLLRPLRCRSTLRWLLPEHP